MEISIIRTQKRWDLLLFGPKHMDSWIKVRKSAYVFDHLNEWTHMASIANQWIIFQSHVFDFLQHYCLAIFNAIELVSRYIQKLQNKWEKTHYLAKQQKNSSFYFPWNREKEKENEKSAGVVNKWIYFLTV